MKSIDKLVNVLTRIAVALENKSTLQPKPSNNKIAIPQKTTTSTTANVTYYSSVYISQQEKNALDSIYRAITDSGNHPKHHDHIMKELKNKWPVLHTALMSLVTAKLNSSNYSENRKIWRNDDI